MKSVFVIACVLVMCSASTATALSGTDKNACYGDTLDVILQVYEPTANNDGEVRFALPNPASWNARLRRDTVWLRNVSCQKEPIKVSEVNGSGMRSKFQDALGFEPGDLELVRSLDLNGGISQTAFEQRLFGTLERFEGQMADIPFGFKRLEAKTGQLFEEYGGRTFASGLIQYPESYTSPVGNPILSWCGGFGYCQVRYTYADRLRIYYEFRSSVDYEKRWIAQDRAIRKLIESWMVTPTPNN